MYNICFDADCKSNKWYSVLSGNDQYLTNIQRMRYVDKSWKLSITGNVDIVVHW